MLSAFVVASRSQLLPTSSGRGLWVGCQRVRALPTTTLRICMVDTENWSSTKGPLQRHVQVNAREEASTHGIKGCEIYQKVHSSSKAETIFEPLPQFCALLTFHVHTRCLSRNKDGTRIAVTSSTEERKQPGAQGRCGAASGVAERRRAEEHGARKIPDDGTQLDRGIQISLNSWTVADHLHDYVLYLLAIDCDRRHELRVLELPSQGWPHQNETPALGHPVS